MLPRQVAGAIEAGTGCLAEGVGDEPLRGLLRVSPVATSHAGAAHADLAHRAQGHRPQILIRQDDAGASHGPAEDDAAGLSQTRPGRVGRGLCRSVKVVNGDAGKAPAGADHQFLREPFAAQEEGAQIRRRRRLAPLQSIQEDLP